MALTNFFFDFDIKCFPFNEVNDVPKYKKIIQERIESLNSATPQQLTYLESKYGDLEDQKTILEDMFRRISDQKYRQRMAEECFNKKYGRFIGALTSYGYNGGITKEDFSKLCYEHRITFDDGYEVMLYRQNDTNCQIIEQKDEKTVFELINEKEYRIIVDCLSEQGFVTTNNTIENIQRYLKVSGNDHQKFIDAIDKKINSFNINQSNNSEGMLLQTLKKHYEDKDSFIKFYNSLRLYDLNPIRDQMLGFIKNGVLSASNSEAIYKLLIKQNYEKDFILQFFKYWSFQKNFNYELTPAVLEYSLKTETCKFCGRPFLNKDNICPICNTSLEDGEKFSNLITRGLVTIVGEKYEEADRINKQIDLVYNDKKRFIAKELVKDIESFKKALNQKQNKKSKIRRRRLVFLLSLILVLVSGGVFTYLLAYRPFEKDFQVEDIYINTVDDFQKIYNNKFLNDNFYLTADLDFNGQTIKPIGSTKYPFNGHFYGNGYELQNFKIVEKNYNYSALFAYSNGNIERLSLQNVTVDGAINGSILVGKNNGSINNCAIYNSKVLVNSPDGITSLFCSMNNGTIISSYVYNSIFEYNDQKLKISQISYAGFVGVNTGQISNSVSHNYLNEININTQALFNLVNNNGKIINCSSIVEQKLEFIDASVDDLKYILTSQINNGEYFLNSMNWNNNIWDCSSSIPSLKKES